MSSTPATQVESPGPQASAPARPKLTAKRLWRLMVAVVVGYRGEKLALRAGNLTFITLTSLVPLAGVILGLLHVVRSDFVESLVMRFFRDILSPGGVVNAENAIHQFRNVAYSPTGSSLSFVVLLVSSGIMLRHLDASLNDVWAVRRSRPIISTLALYLGVLFIGPIAMMLSLLGGDGIRKALTSVDVALSGVALGVGAIVSAMMVFSLLYKVAPHAHVPWRSALIGGAVAGLVWEVSRHLYGTIASLFFSANALYGSLGIAPLFLTWVYVSWYIILSGARLAYAIEHADYHEEFSELLVHPRRDEIVGTRIAQLIARARVAQVPGPTPLGIAMQLKLPTQRIEECVASLQRAGLIRVEAGALFPAKDLVELSVADVSRAVGGVAAVVTRTAKASQFDGVASVFGAADAATVEKLKKMTWADLALLPEHEEKG